MALGRATAPSRRPASEATLRWMVREADGDKLEAIAADEALPAERVRQRVSRLRRWMRGRWLAELAVVTMLAVAGASVLATTRQRYEMIAAGGDRRQRAHRPAPARHVEAGLVHAGGAAPAGPQGAARQAGAEPPGHLRRHHAPGRGRRRRLWSRGYATTVADGGHIEAVETTVDGRRVSVIYAWDG